MTSAQHLLGGRQAGPARHLGRADRDRVLEVTLVLKPRDRTAHRLPARRHPREHPVHDRAALEALYDPGADRFAHARAHAKVHGLRVVEMSRARHDVVLSGTVAQFEHAFAVELHDHEQHGRRHRRIHGTVRLPRALRAATTAVLGMDTTPCHRRHARVANASQAVRSLTVDELRQHYGFPDVDASAHRIAVLQFGGGYHDEDVTAFLRGLGAGQRARISNVAVRGADGASAGNAPLPYARMQELMRHWQRARSFTALAKACGPDLGAFMDCVEVTMDLQLALAFGGGAAVDVYHAAQGVDGWRRAVYAAMGLPVGGAPAGHPPRPAVLSISWGDNESGFGGAGLQVVHHALLAAHRAGILVCASSGDWGSANGPAAKSPNVNFPASSPVVLACGGTLVRGARGSMQDVAWHESLLGATMASGGGMSGCFARPAWQAAITTRPARGTWRLVAGSASRRGRWLPDVAANAAHASAPRSVVGGTHTAGYGTSAATPILAALLVQVRAASSHALAGLGPWLYGHEAAPAITPAVGGTNDVTDGRIGSYAAAGAWNACTGLGTVHGGRLLDQLRGGAPSGRTASRRRRQRT